MSENKPIDPLADVRINNILYAPVEGGEYIEGVLVGMVCIRRPNGEVIEALELKDVQRCNSWYTDFVGKRVRFMVATR